MIKSIAAALFAVLCLPAWARPPDVALPQHVRVDFVERNTGLPTTLDWQRQDGRYRLVLSVLAIVVNIEYRSEGTIDPQQGLKPQQFQELRNGQIRRSVTFDHDARQLRYNNDQGGPPLQDNAQDLLSLAWQLALKGAPADSGLQLTNGRKTYQYAIASARNASIGISGKALHALVYQPKSSGADIQIWLARDYSNTPVRIVYTRPGETSLDLQATSIQTDGKTVWSATRKTPVQE